MYYIVESDKSFYEVTVDLEAVVPRLGFVMLHVHGLSDILRSKGIEFDDECTVFEICHYRQMEKMLAIDIRLGLVLPWRIQVFTENGATKIGIIRPTLLLDSLFRRAELAQLAQDIEDKIHQMVDEAR